MAWWPFGKKRRKSQTPSSHEHKNILDEKRSALSSRNDRSRTISPTPGGLTSNPVDLGSTPYELQREGTPPILTDAPLKSLEPPIRTVQGSPKMSRKSGSARHSRDPSAVSAASAKVAPKEVSREPAPAVPSLRPATDVIPSTPQPYTQGLVEPASTQSPEQVFQEVSQDPQHEEAVVVTGARADESAQERYEPTSEIPRTPEPQRPTRRSSIEDITALPASKRTLERSPHLRPVPESEANIIAGTGPKTLHSANQRTSSRKKSVKRKQEDAIREEQVKVMSAAASPVASPKRAGARSPELLRRDSQRMRDDLARPDINPTSVTSLPVQGSTRSSAIASPESHRLNIGFVALLSPRPTVKYSRQGQYATSALPSRSASRAEARQDGSRYAPEVLKENKKIDELADDMDTRSLRELMERDQRRREKKRRADETRARRRLEKYAARGKKEEEAAQRGEEIPAAIALVTAGTPRTPPASAGASGYPREYPREIHPALRGAEVAKDQPETAEIATTDPFRDPEEELEEPAAIGQSEHLEKLDEGPFADPPVAVEEDIEPLPKEETSPDVVRDVGQPSEEEPSATTQEILEPQAAASTAVVQQLGQSQAESQEGDPAIDTLKSAEAEAKPTEPEQPLKRGGTIASLFRRSIGKRDSTSRKSVAASEKSFSATSRDSMPKAPESLEGLYRPTSTGTPVRTLSKFREELPDTQRVQEQVPGLSAEATGGEAVAPLPGQIETSPETMPTTAAAAVAAAAGAAEISSAEEPAEEEAGRPLSEQLGSVDAEGSWLSGRPRKRTSQQLSVGRSSQIQQSPLGLPGSFGEGEEVPSEIGTPSTEAYFTPSEERPQPFTSTGASSEQALSLNQTAAEIAESQAAVVQGGSDKKAQVVELEPRIQSTHGMLQEFDDDNQGSEIDSSDEEAFIEEATVSEGMPHQAAHARQISAGSAKLLDIAPGEQPAYYEEATASEGITRQASHARHVSAGSAKLLDVSSKRSSQVPPTPPPPLGP